VNIDIGKTIRLNDVIDSDKSLCFIVDTTLASALGATPGLENLSEVLESINEIVDGIIINPGQAEHQAEYLGGKNRATAIVRVDWTNAYRNEDFCLPVSNVKRLMLSNGKDAFRLGASAVVANLLLGFEDDFEACNIKELSILSRECHQLSMPVIADIRPIGPAVTQKNFDESIKLGVSFMQELGADTLIIPDCNLDTYKVISNWMTVPVLLRLTTLPSKKKINEILKNGLAGIVLGEEVIAVDDFNKKIKNISQDFITKV
jgi:DhnA family fructose-bisphosphate aldolase class Ia